jgi:hypothetical protein
MMRESVVLHRAHPPPFSLPGHLFNVASLESKVPFIPITNPVTPIMTEEAHVHQRKYVQTEGEEKENK